MTRANGGVARANDSVARANGGVAGRTAVWRGRTSKLYKKEIMSLLSSHTYLIFFSPFLNIILFQHVMQQVKLYSSPGVIILYINHL